MDSKDSQEKTTWRIKVHNLLSKTEEKGTELRVAKKEAKSLVSWSFELQKKWFQGHLPPSWTTKRGIGAL